ncbi:MAG: amino acid permease [Waddliaceae bacterium]
MSNTQPASSKRVLGVFTLTMINVAAIHSLRNLPMMALAGWASLFFYAVAGFTFFIPCALVSAELATGWRTTGGIYTWVKEAFGARLGFVAIWLQWMENVIWYPTILSFTAATIAYAFRPDLAQNKYYLITMILVIYWLCTLIDAMGMKVAGRLSSIGVIIGTIIPGVFIILLGGLWVASEHPVQIPFSWEDLSPDLSSPRTLVFFVGVLFALGGMEMSAVHAREVENPQNNYPRAIFLSLGIISISYMLGSLAIAAVVPQEELSLVAGIMQTFSEFLEMWNMPWLTPVIAVAIAAGSIASISTWIVGPSRGLFYATYEGHLPPIFQHTNTSGMPTALLLIQGIVVSLLSLAFLLMPTVSSSYWILTNLAALGYLIMYLFMFGAAIRLRYTHPEVKRSYRVPGGDVWGMWVVAGTGLISCLFAFVIGFFPPTLVEAQSLFYYDLFLVVAISTLLIIPLVIDACRKEHWKP